MTAQLGRDDHGQPVVQVSNDHCTGTVHLLGATVTSWHPVGQEEVIFLSGDAVFDGRTAIRGGIPICFPWFGPGRHGDAQPAHGWARITEWSFEGTEETPEATVCRFGLVHDGVKCEYEVTMGSTLEVAFTGTAGQETLDVEQALHTYFAVADVTTAAVQGLEDTTYLDKTQGHSAHRQEGAVTFTQETDRVYLSGGTVTLDDAAAGRRLRIESTGSSDTVVWNPWQEKAAAMKDLPDDGWKSFVCVETANARDHHYVLEPGRSHTMTQRVSVL